MYSRRLVIRKLVRTKLSEHDNSRSMVLSHVYQQAQSCHVHLSEKCMWKQKYLLVLQHFRKEKLSNFLNLARHFHGCWTILVLSSASVLHPHLQRAGMLVLVEMDSWRASVPVSVYLDSRRSAVLFLCLWAELCDHIVLSFLSSSYFQNSVSLEYRSRRIVKCAIHKYKWQNTSFHCKHQLNTTHVSCTHVVNRQACVPRYVQCQCSGTWKQTCIL